MAELADALALGANGKTMWVRVPLAAVKTSVHKGRSLNIYTGFNCSENSKFTKGQEI